MSVSINNSNPKMKKEKINCISCNQPKICIRFDDKNICRPCWNKSNTDTLWCIYCGICGHLGLEENEKNCSNCGKTIGMCCGALYHCQSNECICKKCFDYKCVNCSKELSRDRQYVSDAGDSTMPLCDVCSTTILT